MKNACESFNDWQLPEINQYDVAALSTTTEVGILFPIDAWVLEGLVQGFSLAEITEALKDLNGVNRSSSRLDLYNLISRGVLTPLGRALYKVLEFNALKHLDISTPFFLRISINKGVVELLPFPKQLDNNNLFLR